MANDTPKIWLPDEDAEVTVDTGGDECTVNQTRYTMKLQPVAAAPGFRQEKPHGE